MRLTDLEAMITALIKEHGDLQIVAPDPQECRTMQIKGLQSLPCNIEGNHLTYTSRYSTMKTTHISLEFME